MSRFYKGEDFTVSFNAGEDITGATVQMKYKDPEGTVTTVNATITNASSGLFEASVADTDLTLTGMYKFWSKVTDNSGNVTISEPVDIWIMEEGQP